MEENIIVYPAIYKHFKGKYYATIGISKPISGEEIEKIGRANISVFMYAEHTETGIGKQILIVDGKYRHSYISDDKKEELVIYKSLYDNKMSYARPINMFLSKVDKTKYPNVEQKFRFELVRY